ncbi:gamma-butyrobetaine dioxygenase-like [Macrobrachium nipponense]|uniref:gamma-butyrobetaine dioxygenase-like n=1 Tax=Macrobrachium nipponense TaxID=159736 RepID=UPI0030C7C4AE
MFASKLARSTWRVSAAAFQTSAAPTAAGDVTISRCQNHVPVASRSVSSSARLQKPSKNIVKTATVNGLRDVTEGVAHMKTIEVGFGDKTRSLYPHVWLRENCQCHECFSQGAVARVFLVDELDLNIQPKKIQLENGGLLVTWPDGHTSAFSGQWLYDRSFSDEARAKHRSRANLKKVFWGSDFKIPTMDFDLALTDDRALLEWLVVLEKYGIILVENAPQKKGPVLDLIKRLGFARPTHYGLDYELNLEHHTNNLAYTSSKLGLHTDLPYVDYPPGTTWLHCIRQHEGKGGDNDLSDGVHAAQLLKERDRYLFDVLTRTPIYFQDSGFENYDFDKITRAPSIQLDEEGNISRLNISSQSRDSLMDLDTEGVLLFYKALKALNNILYEISIRVKTKPGDILVLDNFRVLHGRTPYDASSSSGGRSLHNAYIDWSELRSKRRVLQKKFGVELE